MDCMRFLILLFIIIVSAAGYFAVQETQNPKETPNDKGNALEKYELIRASFPKSNSTITSPVLVEGEARGFWFFEADFPVKVIDSAGNELGVGIAHALSDWMSEDFVPFQATVRFTTPGTKEGFVVLEKDNPSGLPEYADELRVPVWFQGQQR